MTDAGPSHKEKGKAFPSLHRQMPGSRTPGQAAPELSLLPTGAPAVPISLSGNRFQSGHMGWEGSEDPQRHQDG